MFDHLDALPPPQSANHSQASHHISLPFKDGAQLSVCPRHCYALVHGATLGLSRMKTFEVYTHWLPMMNSSPVKEHIECTEPWHIQYYKPAVYDILKQAKQFSHCDAVSINTFLVYTQFNAKAVEYIKELWKDLGDWHSALRKKVHVFVSQHYQWDLNNN
ncbi:hypothetical protein V8B97DRAFT_1916227 [Scleroderma yunnanense]